MRVKVTTGTGPYVTVEYDDAEYDDAEYAGGMCSNTITFSGAGQLPGLSKQEMLALHQALAFIFAARFTKGNV